ncbi:hypothetical protein EMCRGX_G023782 [Ephydatia muelleri]|eukprot:Em0015g26a
MVAITILLLVLCQTAVSLAQKCPPWCEALSQCIGSTEPCACCVDGHYRNPLTTRVIGYAFCRQDKDCSFYGDCCNDRTPQPSLQSHRPQWSCKSIGASSDDIGGSYALMVTTCSAEWTDQSVRQKCTNATTFLVTSNSSGVTYSNQYCAICNGERPTDLVCWLQYYTCPIANYTNVAVTDLVQLCTFQHFTPPDCPGCVTRPCVSQAIRTCPDSYEHGETAERCKSYSCPVVWEDRIYKNLHCALCDGVPALAMEDECAKNYSFEEVELFNATYFSSGSDALVHNALPITSFSLLLDVQNSVYELSGGGSTITGEASKLCKAGQVFVPSVPNMDGYCQDQVCLPGEMRVGTECLKLQCNRSSTTFNLTGSSDARLWSTCFENINDACVQLYSNDTRLSTIVQYYGPLDQLQDGYIGTIEDGGLYKFNATFFFCFNFSHTAIPAQELEILGLVILTYVGGAMSIVGCVVLIITYLLFRELRTLPGKLLMNLAVAILASDIALVGLLTIAHYVSSQKYCVSIAIILHFTFLSRFSWMSVIAFRLLLAFSRPFLSNYSSKILKCKGEKKIFMCAFAFGWLSPLLIVVVCIALNFSVDLIGYGKNSRCWITSRGALIGGFIVPVYLSVLFNTVCFVVTCWSIFCSTLKHKALTGEGKSHVRVYISLGILMGLTWLFGFIAMSVNSFVPWYLFVALNSTQGLLLSITFLCTKRNASLYSSLCRGKAQRGVRPFLTTTSSTQLKVPYTSDSSV